MKFQWAAQYPGLAREPLSNKKTSLCTDNALHNHAFAEASQALYAYRLLFNPYPCNCAEVALRLCHTCASCVVLMMMIMNSYTDAGVAHAELL
jgi:hypothetical protein